MKPKRPVILVVLDGWGHREEKKHNALAKAKTPFFDKIWSSYPHSILDAAGEAVGLPEGQAGGSEIGHLAIGAGRPINSDIFRINRAISNGEFESNKPVQQLVSHVLEHGGRVHLLSLLGKAGIHAHQEHLYAMIRTLKKQGVNEIFIHAFTDGRDTPPHESIHYLEELELEIAKIGVGFIASISGRYFAMDRDNNWDRLEKVENAIFYSEAGHRTKERPSVYLKKLYESGVGDEHIEPVLFLDEYSKSVKIENDDSVIHCNFRADRARMISQRIIKQKSPMNLCYLTMTEYDDTFDSLVAFPAEKIETTLAKVISENGLSQFHTAETEKYAHATYFLNGGVEKAYPKEERIMIKSRSDIKTPDEAPELQAKEVTKIAIQKIIEENDFIFVNYANTDLVGHTANVPAIVKAIEIVDFELKKLCQAALKKNFVVVITSDHGNIELNFDKQKNDKHTGHTDFPVPAIILGVDSDIKARGNLTDIAPTILAVLGLPKPSSMTGENLLT